MVCLELKGKQLYTWYWLDKHPRYTDELAGNISNIDSAFESTGLGNTSDDDREDNPPST